MPKKSSFVEYLEYEVLSEIPHLTSKAMFGGYGFYSGSLIFGIIIDEKLYFKVTDFNKADYQKIESYPFCYATKQGKNATMSYWYVPEEMLENKEIMNEWAKKAIEAQRQTKHL